MSQDTTTALDVFMADRTHPEWVEPAYEALKAERDELRNALDELWRTIKPEPKMSGRYMTRGVSLSSELVAAVFAALARGGDA